jgi:hypothetical protein
VHGADGEVGLAHLLGQPIDLPLCVAENDGLKKRLYIKQNANGTLTKDQFKFLTLSGT